MEFIWLLLAAVLLLFVVMNAARWWGMATGRGAVHCMTCGHDGQAVSRVRGHLWLEVLLWLALLVPGLVYSLWRQTTRARGCALCGSAQIVPADAPAAVHHREQITRRGG